MDIINWINDKLDQETQRLKAELEKVKAEKEELVNYAKELRELLINKANNLLTKHK